MNLTGFDVRGIAMFNGSHQFPVSGLNMSDSSKGDGELLNPDGYTALYNSSTQGHGMEGYLKGKLASSTFPNASLNGYKYHATNKPENTRNAFYAGDEVVVTYKIKIPKPFVFGYAVDACWTPPAIKPVTDPMKDFPPEANCPETWKIAVTSTPVGEGLTNKGGQTKLTIDIYDWQGKDSAYPVSVECPELFDGQISASWTEDATGYTRYEATVGNNKHAAAGAYRCLIMKKAAEYNPSKPWLDLSAYQVCILPVTHTTSGDLIWAKRAGGLGASHGSGVAVLSDNSTVVTGFFNDTSTFGPDESNQTILTTSGDWDIFVARYNPDGTLEWAKKAGGSQADQGAAISALPDDSTVVAGYFSSSATFGKGETNQKTLVSAGNLDIFIAKYNPDGTLAWVKGMGDTGYDYAIGVAGLSNGTSIMIGVFQGSVTFGKGESNQTVLTTGGDQDIFIAKYSSGGSLLWAKQAGGTDFDYGLAISAFSDNAAITTGSFADTATFGAGEPNETVLTAASSYANDIFIAKYNIDGTLAWAKRAGGVNSEEGDGITTLSDGSSGVTGYFEGPTTFGQDEPNQTTLDAKGAMNLFVARYNPDGSLAWAKSAPSGGTYESNQGNAVTALSDNSTVATGQFYGKITFGKGEPNETVLTSSGYAADDIFIAKYNSDGTLAWARQAVGGGEDWGSGLATLLDNTFAATGCFGATAIFGKGESNQTSLTCDGDYNIFVARYNP